MRAIARRITRWARTAAKAVGRQGGMTLVEIMVVITIIGLIIGVVSFAVIPALTSGEAGAAKMQMANLRSMVEKYRMDKGQYPASLTDISPYMTDQRAPKDPWGEDYIYMVKDQGYEIFSKGPDKQQGSDDDVRIEKSERPR